MSSITMDVRFASVAQASKYGIGLGQATTPENWEGFYIDQGPPLRCLSV